MRSAAFAGLREIGGKMAKAKLKALSGAESDAWGKRQAVLCDPECERAGLQCGSAVRALSDAAKARRQRDGKDGQRHQHLDQRESFASG